MNISQESDVLQDELQLFHVTHGFAFSAPGSLWLLPIHRPSTSMVFYKVDCEQFLSFPSVFLAFLRASVQLSSDFN